MSYSFDIFGYPTDMIRYPLSWQKYKRKESKSKVYALLYVYAMIHDSYTKEKYRIYMTVCLKVKKSKSIVKESYSHSKAYDMWIYEKHMHVMHIWKAYIWDEYINSKEKKRSMSMLWIHERLWYDKCTWKVYDMNMRKHMYAYSYMNSIVMQVIWKDGYMSRKHLILYMNITGYV